MQAAYVQSKTVQSSGATSVTTPAMTSTSGNFLAAHADTDNPNNLSGSPVADSNSNTWANAWLDNGSNGRGGLYYSENIAGGSSHTVTFTRPGGASGACALGVSEFSGVDASSSLDKTAHASSTPHIKASGATSTTSQADELVIGSGSPNGNSNPSSNPGLFIDAVALADSSPEGILSSYAIVSALAAYAFAFDYGTVGSPERVGVATFKGTSIAFVQAKSVQSSGATSVTTPAMTSTSGNFLSALGSSFTRTFSGSPIADSKSNAWSNAWAGTLAGQYYSENIAGGSSHTVTVTPPGGSSACALAVLEFSGVDASSSLDKTATASSSAAPHSSGATATTSQANELVLGGASVSHGNGAPYSQVAGGPWTDLFGFTGVAGSGLIMAYQVASAQAAFEYKYNGGYTSTLAMVVGVATFKSSSGGSSGSVDIGVSSVDGSGTEAIPGTGGVTLGPPAVQGSPLISGDGGVRLSPPAVDALGDAVDNLASRVEISHPSVDGSGDETITGDGAVTISLVGISAVGSAPSPTPSFTTNRLYPAPSGATGISVTPSSTSWGWSSWFELEPSTTAAWLLAGLVIMPDRLSSGQSTVEFEVGVGAPGAETAVDRFRGHWATPVYSCPGELPRPILLDAIPANRRVSIRMRKNNTATTVWHVSAVYYKKPFAGSIPASPKPQKTYPDGANNVALGGLAGGWVNSALTTLIASTPTALALCGIIPVANSLPGDWEFDLCIGAVDASVVTVTTVRLHHSGVLPVDGPTLIPFYQPLDAIPAGSRVSVRARTSASITGGTSVLCSLIGMELPL